MFPLHRHNNKGYTSQHQASDLSHCLQEDPCVAPHKAEDAADDHLITPIMLPPPNPDKNEQFQQRKLGRNLTSAYGIMSISTLYRDALQKYGKLVLDFEEHASPLAPTFQAHSVGIKDEYGRLRIWGEQTRAVLPEKARHSLDEQLRENEQTRNIILRTLRRLTNHIETVQSSRFGGCDDFSSSDESLSTQSSAPGPPKSRLCKAIESVFDGIRSLYRISALLKRPRNANKYLRSRNMIMPSQATLRAEEDHAHILEKMRQWRHLTMRSQVGGDEERAVTLDDIISRKLDENHELADITFLCQRLTWANKLRRSQFKYWEESPDIPETQEEDIVSRSNSKRVETKDLSATQTSFSSVAISALAETRTEAGRLRTEHTNSVVGGSNAIRHLATHMEEIALFVLPLPPQDDEAEGNYDDLNEESFLGSEDLPGQAETSYEEDQVLVSGTRHGRPEEDLGSLGEGSEVGQSSAAVILENGKPSHIYDETAEEIKKLEEEKARLQAESLINALKALQAEIKATADAVNEKNKVVQAESDKIAALLADFEAKRLEREDRLMLKLPVGRELANIATTARETAEREATITVVIAEAENEKAFAEAKPRPDADKAPIMFTDAVDRKFTLPWHMAKTWKGMEALIKQAFVNIEHIGPHIANGHYHLLGPNNEIILPQVWEVAVQPGWDIKMQLWPLPEPTKDGNTSVSPGYEAPRKSHLERRTNPASSRPKSDSHQVTRKSNRLSASSHSAAVIGSEHLPYASQERRLLRSDRTYTESIWMGVHGRIPELLPNLIDLDPYDKPDIPAFCEPNNAEDQEEDAHQRLGLDT
ncbi:hypothetical protein D6D29_06767 [Aureobasidium pullulans]|nr:hypothetical protein D6D29_06767 [Aureobasidium pullulans]